MTILWMVYSINTLTSCNGPGIIHEHFRIIRIGKNPNDTLITLVTLVL